MALRLVQFLAIMLTALALVPSGALVANLAHAIVLRKLGRSFGYALASFC